MKNTEYLSNGMGGIVLSAKEAQDVLRTSPAYEEYLSLTEDFRREILDIVRGAKGLRITYDPFFKHVFDPVLHGERLSRLLTVIIGQQVTVKQVLPSQSKRLTAEASLIIMDIVVELESGALANVEIQKVGYRFPGQRSACYSSDLIIRQYDRQKSRKKKKFSYRDLQKVYTIVLVENSSAEFHRIPNQYIHRSSQKFDTGLELELLQEYIFIALDIFREITHNIDKELDAWLYFLSSDEPEELIAMYNETLALFDKNTVELMIEEQQEEIKKLAEEVRNKKAELEQSKTELEQSKADQREKDKELRKKDEELARLRSEIERLGGNTGE